MSKPLESFDSFRDFLATISDRIILRDSAFQSLKKDRKSGQVMAVVQSISRHYGGPEEGGWWYDLEVNEESSRAFGLAGAIKLLRTLEEEFVRNRHDRYSVLGGEDYCFYLTTSDDLPRETTSRPRYE